MGSGLAFASASGCCAAGCSSETHLIRGAAFPHRWGWSSEERVMRHSFWRRDGRLAIMTT